MMLSKDRIDALLDVLRTKAENIGDIVPFLPDDLKKELMSEEFRKMCMKEFKEMDQDFSGVLEPKELMPLVMNMAEAHQFALTEEHCVKFVDIFDSKRNGVLTLSEFITFVRFMLVMAYLDTEDGRIVSENVAVKTGEAKVDDLLRSLEGNRGAMHKVIPMLPQHIFD